MGSMSERAAFPVAPPGPVTMCFDDLAGAVADLRGCVEALFRKIDPVCKGVPVVENVEGSTKIVEGSRLQALLIARIEEIRSLARDIGRVTDSVEL